MTTANVLVTRAYDLIGYKDPSEALSGADASAGLDALNSMVDAWAVNALYVYATTYVTQSVSGQSVTIGPGATINITRPVRVPAGGFFRSGDIDYSFEMIGRVQYEAFVLKSIDSPWPRFAYYEPSSPAGTLYFYPAVAATGELHLPVEQRITEFANLTTDYTLPPGYRAALEYSLAEELAPGKVDLSPVVAQKAFNYRRNITRFESPILSSGLERSMGNVLSGWES